MKPLDYAHFCAGYGFELTPAQRVLGMVCCDPVDPCDLHPEEQKLAAELLGEGVDVVPPLAREVLVWKKGARVGGTRMAAMRSYQLPLTVELPDLAPGESAYVLFIGPDMRLARQAYAYALAAAKTDAARGGIVILHESKESFTFERHDGRLITAECLPATVGGSAVRGRTLVCAVMTEGAFFRDPNYAINDAEVYRALAPRIVKGGQLIIESTPWAEAGLLFELWRDNFGDPKTALVANCPTLLMRPDARTRGLVERERKRDPDNARREFDGEFLTAGTGLFFDPAAIDACVDPTLVLLEGA